jgi:hypothetical protein
MASCLLFFSPDPIDGDAKQLRQNTFQISMMEGCYKNQPWCLCTALLPCCSAYYTRHRALDGDLSRYACCQGYFDSICFRAGSCNESQCPHLCLMCEAFCCVGPSMSASRIFISDLYDLRPDPMDNRMIRFTNCLTLLSCVCDVASMFDENLRHLAHLIHVAAEVVFYTTLGCMAAQVNREIDVRKATSAYAVVPEEALLVDENNNPMAYKKNEY